MNWWPGHGGPVLRTKLLGREYAIGNAHNANDNVGAVNFANQLGIYLLHNGFETVYVGQTTNNNRGLFQRLQIHCNEPRKGPFWDKFSWFGFKPVAPVDEDPRRLANNPLHPDMPTVSLRTLIKVVETIVIQACLPKLNGQAGQLLGTAFLQVRDRALNH